jgi:hypothetical protein
MEIVLIKSLLLGAALTVATPALFAQVAPITQFVTPTVYKTLSQDAREKYVAGVLDAESSLVPQGFAAIRPCVKGADVAVLTAAVDRFMVGQPTHGNDMPLNVHNAIVGICKQS